MKINFNIYETKLKSSQPITLELFTQAVTEQLLSWGSEKQAHTFRVTIPTVNPDAIRGVPFPKIRQLVRFVARDNPKLALEFLLDTRPEYNYFLSITIFKCFLFEVLYDANVEKCLAYLPEFLTTMIRNWCAADTFASCLQRTKSFNSLENYKTYLEPYLFAENKTYATRVALVFGFKNFSKDLKQCKILLKNYLKVTNPYFYCQMAVAWGIATIYACFPRDTYDFLLSECQDLSDWTFNRAISKICQSYNVKTLDKQQVQKLKRKVSPEAPQFCAETISCGGRTTNQILETSKRYQDRKRKLENPDLDLSEESAPSVEQTSAPLVAGAHSQAPDFAQEYLEGQANAAKPKAEVCPAKQAKDKAVLESAELLARQLNEVHGTYVEPKREVEDPTVDLENLDERITDFTSHFLSNPGSKQPTDEDFDRLANIAPIPKHAESMLEQLAHLEFDQPVKEKRGRKKKLSSEDLETNTLGIKLSAPDSGSVQASKEEKLQAAKAALEANPDQGFNVLDDYKSSSKYYNHDPESSLINTYGSAYGKEGSRDPRDPYQEGRYQDEAYSSDKLAREHRRSDFGNPYNDVRDYGSADPSADLSQGLSEEYLNSHGYTPNYNQVLNHPHETPSSSYEDQALDGYDQAHDYEAEEENVSYVDEQRIIDIFEELDREFESSQIKNPFKGSGKAKIVKPRKLDAGEKPKDVSFDGLHKSGVLGTKKVVLSRDVPKNTETTKTSYQRLGRPNSQTSKLNEKTHKEKVKAGKRFVETATFRDLNYPTGDQPLDPQAIQQLKSRDPRTLDGRESPRGEWEGGEGLRGQARYPSYGREFEEGQEASYHRDHRDYRDNHEQEGYNGAYGYSNQDAYGSGYSGVNPNARYDRNAYHRDPYAQEYDRNYEHEFAGEYDDYEPRNHGGREPDYLKSLIEQTHRNTQNTIFANNTRVVEEELGIDSSRLTYGDRERAARNLSGFGRAVDNDYEGNLSRFNAQEQELLQAQADEWNSHIDTLCQAPKSAPAVSSYAHLIAYDESQLGRSSSESVREDLETNRLNMNLTDEGVELEVSEASTAPAPRKVGRPSSPPAHPIEWHEFEIPRSWLPELDVGELNFAEMKFADLELDALDEMQVLDPSTIDQEYIRHANMLQAIQIIFSIVFHLERTFNPQYQEYLYLKRQLNLLEEATKNTRSRGRKPTRKNDLAFARDLINNTPIPKCFLSPPWVCAFSIAILKRAKAGSLDLVDMLDNIEATLQVAFVDLVKTSPTFRENNLANQDVEKAWESLVTAALENASRGILKAPERKDIPEFLEPGDKNAKLAKKSTTNSKDQDLDDQDLEDLEQEQDLDLEDLPASQADAHDLELDRAPAEPTSSPDVWEDDVYKGKSLENDEDFDLYSPRSGKSKAKDKSKAKAAKEAELTQDLDAEFIDPKAKAKGAKAKKVSKASEAEVQGQAKLDAELHDYDFSADNSHLEGSKVDPDKFDKQQISAARQAQRQNIINMITGRSPTPVQTASHPLVDNWDAWNTSPRSGVDSSKASSAPKEREARGGDKAPTPKKSRPLNAREARSARKRAKPAETADSWNLFRDPAMESMVDPREGYDSRDPRNDARDSYRGDPRLDTRDPRGTYGDYRDFRDARDYRDQRDSYGNAPDYPARDPDYVMGLEESLSNIGQVINGRDPSPNHYGSDLRSDSKYYDNSFENSILNSDYTEGYESKYKDQDSGRGTETRERDEDFTTKLTPEENARRDEALNNIFAELHKEIENKRPAGSSKAEKKGKSGKKSAKLELLGLDKS